MKRETTANNSRYLFSISISVYNKWMFKEEKGDGETKNIFPFPLFTTCLHMIVQFTLASLVHGTVAAATARLPQPPRTRRSRRARGP
jgi:hypothetical protein